MATDTVVVEGSSGVTASQLKDLMRQVADRSITGAHLQKFLDHKDPFAEERAEKAQRARLPLVLKWREVYDCISGVREYAAPSSDKFLDFMTQNVTRIPDGKWFIPVVGGLTIKVVARAMENAELGPVTFCVDDPDRNIASIRDPLKGSYGVCVSMTVDPDIDLRGKTGNELQSAGVQGITLLERLLLGFAYHQTTGQHLDPRVSTLCTGSVFRNNEIPRVSEEGRRGVLIAGVQPDVRPHTMCDWSARQIK